MTPLAGNLNLSSLIDERVRGPGTISEFDSGGCQQLSPNAWARACLGCGSLYRVLGKGIWCFQNRKSFPDPVSVDAHPQSCFRKHRNTPTGTGPVGV